MSAAVHAVLRHPVDVDQRVMLTRDADAPHPRDEDPAAWEHDPEYRASRRDDEAAWHEGRVYRLRLQQRGQEVPMLGEETGGCPGNRHCSLQGEHRGQHRIVSGPQVVAPTYAWHDVDTIGALYLDQPDDVDTLLALAAEQWAGWKP